MRSFEMPWRPTFEAWAALAWLGSLIGMMVVLLTTALPSTPFLVMAGMSFGIFIWRARQAKRLFDFKVALAGKPFDYMSTKELQAKMEKFPGQQWMGYGFNWLPIHTQRAIEARKLDIRSMLPPDWYLKLRKIPKFADVVGMPWIHGLEPNEEDLKVTLKSTEGHNVIFGTTGAGKTRMMETIVFQAVMRGDPVWVIDPKGDKELKEIIQNACKTAGRPEAFVNFNPTFPSESIRLDPLRNWARETQIASRVVMMMDSDGGSDGFVAFAWRTINAVNDALLYVGKRPTLKMIDKNVAGGPDELMRQVLIRFFQEHYPSYEALTASYVEKASSGKLPAKAAPGTSPELLGYIAFYKKEVPHELRPQPVDKLLEIVEHPREHYSKVITNVLPHLAILNSGELGALLSPDADDINDTRPIFDTGKLIRGKHVVYIGLDTLSDQTVGQALGSILLADLAATAGAIYNSPDYDKSRINLLIDESSEVVNKPLIQILNKARGAGFVVWLFAQTYPDFVVKMGSDPAARMIFGNCNNLYALRTKCRQTQDFIVETFGETMIQQKSVSHGSGSKSEDTGLEFSGTVTESMSEQSTSVIPPELLGMLPDLQYIAMVAGGKLYKGRVPKLM